MRKVITVDSCEDCKFVWWYLGVDACCSLMNKKGCFDDKSALVENENQPSWCPLPNASDEMIEQEKKLIKSKGLIYE